MSKHIGAYGKQTFAVNLRHPSKTIQEAKKCTAYFIRIENGLFLKNRLIPPNGAARGNCKLQKSTQMHCT